MVYSVNQYTLLKLTTHKNVLIKLIKCGSDTKNHKLG